MASVNYSQYGAELEQPNNVRDNLPNYSKYGAELESSPLPSSGNIPNNTSISDYNRSLFTPLMSTPSSALAQAGSETWKNPNARSAAAIEASFLLPTEFLAPGIPYLSKIGNALGRIGTQSGLSAGMSALSGGNPLEEAKKTGVIGAGLEALSPALGIIGAGINKITSASKVNDIMNLLGSGQTLQQNAKSLANDISSSFLTVKKESKDLYDPVFNQVGSKNIYEDIPKEESNYLNLSPDITDSYSYKIKKLNSKFLDDPSFQNAHDLQSSLGSRIRDFQRMDARKNLNSADRNIMEQYQEAQNKLNQDQYNFLDSQGSDLKNQYLNADTHYATEVSPYLETPKISEIAKGKVTNPKNITSIFQKPEPEVEKIVEDMGPDAAHKILYSEVGKLGGNPTADQLLNSYSGLGNKGLENYVTPTLSQQMAQLQRSTTKQKAMTHFGGAVAGYLLGSHFGIPAEAVGALFGSAALPKALSWLPKSVPSSQFEQNLRGFLSNSYRPAGYAGLQGYEAANQ